MTLKIGDTVKLINICSDCFNANIGGICKLGMIGTVTKINYYVADGRVFTVSSEQEHCRFRAEQLELIESCKKKIKVIKPYGIVKFLKEE